MKKGTGALLAVIFLLLGVIAGYLFSEKQEVPCKDELIGKRGRKCSGSFELGNYDEEDDMPF